MLTRPRAVHRIAVLVVVPAALLGACSDDDQSSGATTTTDTAAPSTVADSSSTTTTTTLDSGTGVEGEVTAAYEAASAAFLEAAAIPDPDFPAVLDTHVDPLLHQRRGVLTQLKVDGRVIRLPEPSISRIEVESFELLDEVTAVLVACIVDDGERYDAATGQLLTDGLPGTGLWEIGMRFVEGRWRLAEQIQRNEWGGISGCATD